MMENYSHKSNSGFSREKYELWRSMEAARETHRLTEEVVHGHKGYGSYENAHEYLTRYLDTHKALIKVMEYLQAQANIGAFKEDKMAAAIYDAIIRGGIHAFTLPTPRQNEQAATNQVLGGT